MQLLDNQAGSYALQAEDAVGNPTTLDPNATPVWSISNPSIATLTPAANGLTCAVQPTGTIGQATVQCSIAAVDQEPALMGSDTLTIVAGPAAQIVLVGTPAASAPAASGS